MALTSAASVEDKSPRRKKTVVTVHELFRGDDVDVVGLAAHLESLTPADRVAAVRELTAREQALLFEAARGIRPVSLEDFVPAGEPPLRQIIHYGRNSLPVFRMFEKRFCRSPRESGELWGYNEQTWKTFTGPGYFVARAADDGEVLIDYTEVPPDRPREWPEILPNSARLSRFIYNGTRDFMRGVSRHVTIGRATRDGKPMDNWFVLCREGG
jgi:hypothetical protein